MTGRRCGRCAGCWNTTARISGPGVVTECTGIAPAGYSQKKQPAFRVAPVGKERYLPTSKRIAAVELLLNLGYNWNGSEWVAPADRPSAPASAPVRTQAVTPQRPECPHDWEPLHPGTTRPQVCKVCGTIRYKEEQ